MRGGESSMHRILKGGAIVALVVLAIAFFFVPHFRAGYQVSIYNQLPGLSIILAAMLIVASTSFAVYLITRNDYGAAIGAQLPASAVFGVILTLPWLLGYQIRGGDAMTHAGDIIVLLSRGHLPAVPRTVFAAQRGPAFHTLGAVVSLLGGISPAETLHLFRVFMPVAFVAIAAAFARWYGFSGAVVVIVAPLALLPAVNPSSFVYPTLFIVALFLWVRSPHRGRGSQRFALLLFLLMILFWIYHVVPPLLVLSVIVLTSIGAKTMRWLSARRQSSIEITRATWFVIVGSLAGFVLFSNTHYMTFVVYRLFLSQGRDTSSLTDISQTAARFGLSATEIFTIAAQTLGDWGILLGGAALSVGVLWRWRGSHRRFPVALVVGVAFVTFWSVSELLTGGIVVGWQRALRPAVILAVVLIAGGITTVTAGSWKPDRPDRSTVIAVGLVTLMVSSGLLLSARNAYQGPWVESSNDFVVESEISGWEWFFAHKDRSERTITLGRRIDRYSEYLLGINQRMVRSDELQAGSSPTAYRVPENLGYPESLGAVVGPAYFLSTEAVRLNRIVVHPEWNVITQRDLNRLRGDSTAARVYSNGNVNLYHVSA